MSSELFSSLPLRSDLLANLESLAFHEMTPVQARSLPLILSGCDVIAQAKTGSGKTAAFGLGLLQQLDVKRFRVQALVLCPTRELADQVAAELRRLARGIHNIKILTLCGGMPMGPQIASLEHGAHIIVGTPGRIEDHLKKERLLLDDLNTLVLDEADRMLQMGFQDSVDAIVAQAPQQRQTLLFSATYPEEIQSIATRVLCDPEHIVVEGDHDQASIQQFFYQVGPDMADRIKAVRLLLMKYTPESALLFCTTKMDAQSLSDELNRYGFSALALHGDLEQRDRNQTLVRFANRSVSVLVATDVAARGLDISDLDAVINVQLAHDPEVHVHRVGRTGRAGSQGFAFSLYSEREKHKLQNLAEYLGQNCEPRTLPSESILNKPVYRPPMNTLQIDGGRKQKVRPGDILGALTGMQGIEANQVGKIQIAETSAYVAVTEAATRKALEKLSSGKLKGRSFRVRKLR